MRNLSRKSAVSFQHSNAIDYTTLAWVVMLAIVVAVAGDSVLAQTTSQPILTPGGGSKPIGWIAFIVELIVWGSVGVGVASSFKGLWKGFQGQQGWGSSFAWGLVGFGFSAALDLVNDVGNGRTISLFKW